MKRFPQKRLTALLLALMMLISMLPLSLIAEEEFFWDGDEAGVETEYYEQESPDAQDDAGDFFMPEITWDDSDSHAEEPEIIPEEPIADDEEGEYEPAEEPVWEENEEEPTAEIAEALIVRDAFWQNGHAKAHGELDNRIVVILYSGNKKHERIHYIDEKGHALNLKT